MSGKPLTKQDIAALSERCAARTPGDEWTAEIGEDDRIANVIYAGTLSMGMTYLVVSHIHYPSQEADFALMGAAPRLLATCEHLLERIAELEKDIRYVEREAREELRSVRAELNEALACRDRR